MAKQIYIDENGNEVLVSGTITNAGNLPLGSDFSDPTSTAGAIAALQDREEYKVRVSQMSLPSTITLTANVVTQILNDVDIRTLGYSALDDIRNMTGTLVACGFMWCSGGGAYCPDTLVSGGKVSMSIMSTVTKDITAIRLWTIWRQ